MYTYVEWDAWPTTIILLCYVVISSSSCLAASADIPDPLRNPCLLSIAPRMSSRLHLLSTQSCCIQVQAGRPTFASPCEGAHRNTSLMKSSLLLQQCNWYLVRLTCIAFVIGSRWLYSCCFMGCCRKDFSNAASCIFCVIAINLFLHMFS